MLLFANVLTNMRLTTASVERRLTLLFRTHQRISVCGFRKIVVLYFRRDCLLSPVVRIAVVGGTDAKPLVWNVTSKYYVIVLIKTIGLTIRLYDVLLLLMLLLLLQMVMVVMISVDVL